MSAPSDGAIEPGKRPTRHRVERTFSPTRISHRIHYRSDRYRRAHTLHRRMYAQQHHHMGRGTIMAVWLLLVCFHFKYYPILSMAGIYYRCRLKYTRSIYAANPRVKMSNSPIFPRRPIRAPQSQAFNRIQLHNAIACQISLIRIMIDKPIYYTRTRAGTVSGFTHSMGHSVTMRQSAYDSLGVEYPCEFDKQIG